MSLAERKFASQHLRGARVRLFPVRRQRVDSAQLVSLVAAYETYSGYCSIILDDGVVLALQLDGRRSLQEESANRRTVSESEW